MEFKCYSCEKVFEAEGDRKDYMDPMYGPCTKMIAACPACGGESSEYRKPKAARNNASSPQESCPAYHSGSCSCCH